MNKMEEYLHLMQDHRREPHQFRVVCKDYSVVVIDEIHDFNLATITKEVIGVAIHLMDGPWFAYYLNPYGGTIAQSNIWKPEQAVDLITRRHSELARELKASQPQDNYWHKVMRGQYDQYVSPPPAG